MDLDELIRRTWKEHHGAMLLLADRLIAHAAAMGAPVPPTSQDVRIAREAAHRFAGSLGMYGIMEGSEVATTLETYLAAPSRHPLSSDEFRAGASRLRELIEAGPPGAAELVGPAPGE